MQDGNGAGRTAWGAQELCGQAWAVGDRENGKKSDEAGRVLTPTPSKNFRFRSGSGRANRGVLPPHSMYLTNGIVSLPAIVTVDTKLYLYPMYNDLTVRNGRLINNRPNGITGIQQAAQIKKEMKRAAKISVMEEAIYRAEMRADMVESMMPAKRIER